MGINTMDKKTGFTLIEVLIVVAIAAILAVVGLPELRTFVLNNRLTGHTNDLVGSLNYARGESVSTSQSNIFVSPYSTVASIGWSKGWRVWIDSNNDDARAGDGSEDLKLFELNSGVTLKAEIFTTNCGAGTASTFFNRFGFFATGLLNAGVGNDCIRFLFCDKRDNEHQRRITVERTGRARLNVIQPTQSTYQANCP